MTLPLVILTGHARSGKGSVQRILADECGHYAMAIKDPICREALHRRGHRGLTPEHVWGDRMDEPLPWLTVWACEICGTATVPPIPEKQGYVLCLCCDCKQIARRIARTPRWLLQHLGTEGSRYEDPDVWGSLAAHRVEVLRYDGYDPEYGRWGGLVPKIDGRPVFGGVPDRSRRGVSVVARYPNEIEALRATGNVEVWRVVGAHGEIATGDHASEMCIDGVRADREVRNAGTLDDLHWEVLGAIGGRDVI